MDHHAEPAKNGGMKYGPKPCLTCRSADYPRTGTREQWEIYCTDPRRQGYFPHTRHLCRFHEPADLVHFSARDKPKPPK